MTEKLTIVDLEGPASRFGCVAGPHSPRTTSRSGGRAVCNGPRLCGEPTPDLRNARLALTRRLFLLLLQPGEVKLTMPEVNLLAVEFGAASLPGRAIEAMSRALGVEAVEVDPPRYPMCAAGCCGCNAHASTTTENVPYGVKLVDAFDCDGRRKALFDGVKGAKVCIIDSGLAGSHEDIGGTKTGFPTGW